MRIDSVVRNQYRTVDPLKIRIETHRRYSERSGNLNEACWKLLELSGEESLLEVGCGPGGFLRYLRDAGFHGRLAGLDQSTAMIAEAKTITAGCSPPVDGLIGEANALPFAGGSFDAVVARHMLYHVPDIPGALREFGRVLRPGGVVLLTTNSERSLPHIADLANTLLHEFGLPGRKGGAVLSFNVENAVEILGSVFSRVKEVVVSNALLFTEPEPIVEYIATMGPFWEMRSDLGQWNEMRARLLDEAKRRLARSGGLWRDPKDLGIYLCREH